MESSKESTEDNKYHSMNSPEKSNKKIFITQQCDEIDGQRPKDLLLKKRNLEKNRINAKNSRLNKKIYVKKLEETFNLFNLEIGKLEKKYNTNSQKINNDDLYKKNFLNYQKKNPLNDEPSKKIDNISININDIMDIFFAKIYNSHFQKNSYEYSLTKLESLKDLNKKRTKFLGEKTYAENNAYEAFLNQKNALTEKLYTHFTHNKNISLINEELNLKESSYK